MHTSSYEALRTHLEAGHVYRRSALLSFSKAVDRDLMTLTKKGVLEKVGPGLYYSPAVSRFGRLPPREEDLVRCFLQDDHFLLYSWNEYNNLGLGLTQLYNRWVVYNRKRHDLLVLNGRQFDFRRPTRGFPSHLTPEFLLVDLVNNLEELAEETEFVKPDIRKNLAHFDRDQLLNNARSYGKIGTRRFFEEILR